MQRAMFRWNVERTGSGYSNRRRRVQLRVPEKSPATLSTQPGHCPTGDSGCNITMKTFISMIPNNNHSKPRPMVCQ